MSDPVSTKLFEDAQSLIVGGVNSPVRAFRAVGGTPVFVARAEGARIYGADGRPYIDYVGSWGPAILGHAHPAVVEAVRSAAGHGLSYGAPTDLEIRFARAIRKLYPSMELLRCVSSGTEATMSAIRAARGFTGRDLLIKFEGLYHGHADHLLVKAGSGAATFGTPDSAGIPAQFAQTTLTLPYNDQNALTRTLAEHGPRVAAVIVEPVVGNMGVVPPAPGFLQAMVEGCERAGAVSIFDEVMTGCRLAPGGAQQLFGLRPDLTCLGKVVGGGMPLAVYGGRREIMSRVAPLGPVYQAGTLSGNPIAISAGLATLALLSDAVYEHLEAMGTALENGLCASISRHEIKACVQRVGSMLTVFFKDAPVTSWAEADGCDRHRFAVWHNALLERGVYWPPSQFEAAFLSHAHTREDIQQTIERADDAFRATKST